MKKIFTLGRFAIIAFIFTAILVIGARPKASAAATEIPINLGYYPGAMFHMMQYVAAAKGFYKQEGLKVAQDPVSSGPVMNSELAGGAIDFGYSAPNFVGVAQKQGLDLVFITGNVTMPWVLIARSNLQLPHHGHYPAVIRDLKGLNWGVYGRGSDGEVFMRAMAQDAKLNVDKDMAWVGVGGPPTGLPALKVGKIDVYLTLSPADAIATALGYGKIVLDLRKGEGPNNFKNIIYQGVVTTRKTAEAKPQAVEAIIRAHTKAYCWIRNPKNFGELVQIVKTRVPVGGLSQQQLEAAVKAFIPTMTLEIRPAQFAIWTDMLQKSKVLESPVTAKNQLWHSVPRSNPNCKY